jgi:hypothetical protein
MFLCSSASFASVSEIDSGHHELLCFHSIGQVAECRGDRISETADARLKVSPDHRNDLVAIASDKYPFPFGLKRFIRFLKLDHHGFEFTAARLLILLVGQMNAPE